MGRRAPKLRGLFAWAALLTVWGAGSTVAAAESDAAEALFQRAVAALDAADFAVACPLIEDSYAIDPALGTLLASASCFERWGKLHSAEQRYRRVVDEIAQLKAADQQYRAEQTHFARAAATRLKPLVPIVALVPPHSTKGGLELFLDGKAVSVPESNSAISVDPGAHSLELRAPGHMPWTRELSVVPGERLLIQLEIGPLRPTPPSPGPQRMLPPDFEVSAPHAAVTAPTPTPWRSVGWLVGGVGAAGMIVGTVAGMRLLDACPSFRCPAGDGGARNLALATDIGLAVGLAGILTSFVILQSGGSSSKPAVGKSAQPVAVIAPQGAWIAMGQSW
jgi:hypothetical protein